MLVGQLPLFQLDLDRVAVELEVAQLRVETSDLRARAQFAVAFERRADVVVQRAKQLQLRRQRLEFCRGSLQRNE